MNISTLVGFLASVCVFGTAVFLSSRNMSIFLDLHAILIVIGGTCAASLVCFSLPQIGSLFRIFVRRMLGKAKRDYIGIVGEISTLSTAMRKGKSAFESAVKQVRDPFLRDAAGVLFWAESEVSDDQLRDLLETRADTHYTQYLDEANIFRTISKFPPAFGLMGTTLGMISLLQSLGSADSKNTIGPSMAIGLVATLYGVALTNFILIPIAENLTKQTKEDLVARRMVVEGVMMIHADLPTKFIEEKVKSFLLPSQRADVPSQPGNSGASQGRRAA